METKRKTTNQEKEVMEYLNVLRDSGVTNMFGASPYIVSEFGIEKREATKILTLWMSNFDEDGNYETIKL